MKKSKILISLLTSIITMNALTACNAGNTPLQEDNSTIKYESPEHFIMGSSIKLQYPNSIESGNDSILLEIPLSNGNIQKLSFAQIVYLAGDFMGDPNTQIGGVGLEQGMINFDKNFNVMLNAPAKDYLPKIIEIVNKELEDNKEKIHNHDALNIDDNVKFNCATGGGCNSFTMLTNYGLYMKLAAKNYDHFGQDAIDTYQAGHKKALEVANEARITNNPELLRKAYAYEAYSHHFLTDLFASGHLRTPRRAIINACYYTPSDVSSFLAKVMHDQDNASGVWMTNYKGERWKTYGDNQLFIKDNNSSLNKAISVMQQSADQIFQVYNNTTSVDEAFNIAIQELPDLEAINNDPENPKALFKTTQDNKKIYEYKNGQYNEVRACLITAGQYGYKYISR